VGRQNGPQPKQLESSKTWKHISLLTVLARHVRRYPTRQFSIATINKLQLLERNAPSKAVTIFNRLDKQATIIGKKRAIEGSESVVAGLMKKQTKATAHVWFVNSWFSGIRTLYL
jgi:hypothetical protein